MSEGLRARNGFELDLDASFYWDVQKGLNKQDRLGVGLVWQEGHRSRGTSPRSTAIRPFISSAPAPRRDSGARPGTDALAHDRAGARARPAVVRPGRDRSRRQ